MADSILTPREIRRYSRQIMLTEIGTNGQVKLKQAKVLVIGAGGLGCPVLQYLAAAGVGKIAIAEFDMVN
jgi:adenylyltransferase/sulfurtransferase